MRTVTGALVALLLALAAFAGCGGDEDTEEASPEATATPSPSPGATPSPSPKPWTTDWSVSIETGGGSRALVSDGSHLWTVDEAVEEFERYDLAFQTDLDGDRADEAVVSYYTGGAHCCLEYFVFASSSEGIEPQDHFQLGNGSVSEVRDLDADDIPEMVGHDDRLAYFSDLPYATSPKLPLVLCREESGTYLLCTGQFSAPIEDAEPEFEGRLRQAVDEGLYPEEMRGAALGLFAIYLLLGREDAGWAKVEGLCPDCVPWLQANQAELGERLAQALPYRQ